ncbi:MAG: putative methyltransferase [Pelotomaculum sp. PtaB.Bin104]|nr:MAG: putative methyltransferase [Pelotomaculum sp. PtaB.Bin104]
MDKNEKLPMRTLSLADENFAVLAKLFPNAVTETVDENGVVVRAIDADVLAQEINTHVVSGREERYQFTWPDKKKSVLLANAPIAAALRPCREESVDFDNTENLYIEGDNLDVLKLLRETYLNRIKLIYIDPPYNTGKDFIYEDDFAEETGEFLRRDGQYDEQGNRLTPNLDSNGRFHTDWLNMIYPRLRIARDLLTDDGVIFISIDDNEIENLIKICNEIFGEENYINTISLNAKVSAGASGGGEDRKLKKNIEYIVIYCRNLANFPAINPVYRETELMDYINKMKSDGKSFKYTNILYTCEGIAPFKVIKDGNGDDIEISIVNNYQIKTIKQVSKEENLTEKEVFYKYFNQIMTTTNAQTSIRDKVWKATDSDNNMYIASYCPKSGKNKGQKIDLIFMGKQKVLIIWLKDTAIEKDGVLFKREKIGTYWDGFSWINVTKEGSIKFDNGKKPIALIQQMISIIPNNENMTVLDFFSGSATTAHAVINFNNEDGGKRKFIMVQVAEPCDESSEAYKEGYKNICEIGKERIRRAGKKIKEDNKDKEGIENLDIGFRVLKLDSSNMKDVYYTPGEYAQLNFDIEGFMDNIKPDRSDEDLLFQVMLDLGIPLSAKIRQDGKMFYVNDNYLIACFDRIDTTLITEIAKKKPYYAVFRDSSFINDSAMVNFEQVFSTYSPNTLRRVL